jgi:hypothetical protein
MHNEDVHDLHSSLQIIWVVKSRMIEMYSAHGPYWRRTGMGWWGNLKKINHFETLGMDGKIILKWLLKKHARRAWTGLLLHKLVTNGRFL